MKIKYLVFAQKPSDMNLTKDEFPNQKQALRHMERLRYEMNKTKSQWKIEPFMQVEETE